MLGVVREQGHCRMGGRSGSAGWPVGRGSPALCQEIQFKQKRSLKLLVF